MTVPRRHVLRQGAVVRALIRAGFAALDKNRPKEMSVPGPVATDEVPPRAEELVRDYVKHCGGDPAWYRGTVPAHLFPQWGFPILGTRLRDAPYDLSKALNGGCRMEMHAPIPAGEPLQLEACLEDIDDNGRRAVLKNRLTTGTASAPGALVATTYAVVPLKRKDRADAGNEAPKKEKPTVPADAVELARFALTPAHAVDFAILTGDFNPIHWLRPFARMAGFANTILHGFGTLAYAIEALNGSRFANDPTRLTSIDVKFTKPLVLPASVGLYLGAGDQDHHLFVGTAPDGPAYLTGEFTDG